MDWYAKRTLLAGTYVSTEMFMTRDKSAGFAYTLSTMDKYIDQMFETEETLSSVADYTKYSLKTAYNVLASKGIFHN
ncbi:Ubiquinone biosynthesis protein COQ9, mitochondrial [Smittium culicis]|uniref:Ubiquinone biosynthesis protein COQ9, mitochondrial n=1 Tax=Smittium culicis TaxID=133412 RepID=A0A1R1Y6Z6_9FUNG|nr:Ubiquinone biosynthesis protein COQ9, mitochondrial [Smittium culicis]OMJ22584.1 Ubiquinone biosynthesis protein COQ9, mitochondrial [Smittium culicis]